MSRGRRATQRTKYHAGLTPETVIDAAVELTHIKGLETWSLRDLSKELGVAPSAVYHHVGGREVLSQQVVRRVLLMIDAPTTVMPWRDWFRSTLFSARPVLMRYPGVARWLILHGPALPEMAPIVDSAIESLNEAGFGERVGFVCSALINVAMMVIATADDRFNHDGDGPRDYETFVQSLSDVAQGSPGVALISRDVVSRFAGSPDETDVARDLYYRSLLEALMDGFEASLPPRSE